MGLARVCRTLAKAGQRDLECVPVDCLNAYLWRLRWSATWERAVRTALRACASRGEVEQGRHEP
jgi:hypothetical protein